MLRLLAPVTPAVSEECWSTLHFGSDHHDETAEHANESVHEQPFPKKLPESVEASFLPSERRVGISAGGRR